MEKISRMEKISCMGKIGCMEKISCNVIQDLLPLVYDGSASQDTEYLVEEHLQNCESCRKCYEEMRSDFLFPIAVTGEEQEAAELSELRSFRKFISRKRLQIILCSVVGAAALLIAATVFLNRQITHISYKDADITLFKEDGDCVYYKTGIRGNYRWRLSIDRDTGVFTIYFEQSLWERYVECLFYPFDHTHTILKKDLIKEQYIDEDGTEHVIWEASEQEAEEYFRQDRAHQPLG